jgi:signal transduction histidine kinase
MAASSHALDRIQHATRVRYRILIPALITALGILATLVVWARARYDRLAQVDTAFTSIAETNLSLLAQRVGLHFDALRNLAKSWQLYGLREEDAWQFDARLVLRQFPGISWIAWVDRAGTEVRYAARDSGTTAPAGPIALAVAHTTSPGQDYVNVSGGTPSMLVFLPVRTPADSSGVLAADLRSDSLVSGSNPAMAGQLACTIHREDGTLFYSSGQPAAGAPATMRVRGLVPLPSGGEWAVEYAPTEAYWSAVGAPWLEYFLLTGVLLSLALGAVALQLLRLREYSLVVIRANRVLDEQVRELSARDQELSRANQELDSRIAASTAELQDALRELETFSHSLSHDLRSPLGAVQNLVAILEEDYGSRLDQEGLRLLGRIRASSNSAVRLLNELVQLTWAGQQEQERRAVDMNAVARGAFAEAASGDADPGSVDLELSELPPAQGDPTQMTRVFANLLSNALKYTRGRERRQIRVEARPGERANTYVVADNGVGFDPAQADAIFQPFRRLHSAAKYEGTGLGLAIAAKIVRRQGGQIWAESDGRSGARFFVTLPRENGAS